METTQREGLREQTAGELRAVLARRRISAAQLARQLGWKQSYMARRVDGRVALDLDDLEAIAGALGVAVGALLPRSVMSENGVTALFPPAAERPVRNTQRPPDNRSNGHPDSRERSGNRRTARLPRPDRNKTS